MTEVPTRPNPVRAAWRDVEESIRANSVIELTVLMPCLDEAETLGRCIDKAKAFLERTDVRGEVVIADNGSTDGSQAIARLHGARVVPVPTRGYGAALIAGIEAARGRYVIMGDSDDSYDFENLDPFVERLREGYDVVMGNRFRGGIAASAMPPLHRYIGNPVLSLIGRLFFRSPIGDFHCGLRGFSRDAVLRLDLASPGMEFASEMVVKATLAGLKIAEVPTTLSPDGRSRPPHLRSWRDGWRHLKLLLEYAPRWLFLYPGLSLASMGALIAAALIPGPLTIGGVTLDAATLLFSVAAILVGTQMTLFYAVAKFYAVAAGLLPPSERFVRGSEALTVDRFCLIGAGLFAIGIAVALAAVARWAAAGFGDVEASAIIRFAAVSTLFMASGVQSITTGFLIGLLRRPRNAAPIERAPQAPSDAAPEHHSAATGDDQTELRRNSG
jgi:glycosyltransferase involved in cell wall biosynthesis